MRQLRRFVALCLLAGMLAPAAQAQVPQTMSYQGRLLGVGGAPVPDGSYGLTLKIYDVPSGPDAPLWTEVHDPVAVSAGYFHVVLGSIAPLGLPFDAPYWLGVAIEGGDELTPRVELASAPYSLNAQSVADGAVTAAKIPASQVVKSLNSLRDDVTLAPGTNISITPSGQTLTIAATGVGLALPYSGVVSDPGTLLFLSNTGAGGAGSFRVNDAANTTPALQAVSLGLGPALLSDGITNVGGVARSGELYLYRTGVATAMLQAFTQPTGGRLQVHDEAANAVALLTSDTDGTGAYLNVNRSAALSGFVVDGNYLGTSEPRVDIAGSSRSVTFEMGASGSNSVRLPADAVDASETSQEPGLGFRAATGSVALDATVKTILSRTLTAPADGYAVVIGSLQARMTHANGTADALVFGVSDAAATFVTGWTQNVYVPSGDASNTIYTPTTVQGVFPVTAGATTFYLLGREDTGAGTADNALLTVLYFRTAYGTVTSPPAGAPALAPALDGGSEIGGSGLGESDIAQERAEADSFHRARVEREMASMRAEIEELRRTVERTAEREARGDSGVAAAAAR